MKRRILAVCDSDEAYAFRLTECLGLRKQLPFEIRCFTDTDVLNEFLSNHQPELLLISEHELTEQIAARVGDAMLVLTEESSPTGSAKGTQSDMHAYFYKYQSVDSLLQVIFNQMEQSSNQIPKSEERILGIYSSGPGYCRTYFGMAMAQLLAESRTVFYLDLMEYSPVCLPSPDKKFSLADLIFQMRTENTALPIRDLCRNLCGVDYVAPMEYSTDLFDIALNEWQKLFALLESNYHTIVINFGHMLPDLISLLRLCGKLYAPFPENRFWNDSMRSFSSEMQQHEIVIEEVRLSKNVLIEIEEKEDLRQTALANVLTSKIL